MRIEPLFDRVLIEPEQNKKVTEGGIFLPPPAEEKSNFAKVVAVGKGGFVDGKQVSMQVKEGDKILYSKFAGTEIKIDGKTYIIIRQADILAVVE